MAKHRLTKKSVLKSDCTFKVNSEGSGEVSVTGTAGPKARVVVMLLGMAVTAYSRWHGLDVATADPQV